METEQTKQAGSAMAGIPFANILADAVKTTREAQAVSNADAYNLSMGQSDDLTSIMINSNKASTALDMTVQLTTRAVNAYKEVMQMQI